MPSQLNVIGQQQLTIVDFPPGASFPYRVNANGAAGRMVWALAQAAGSLLGQDGTFEFVVEDVSWLLDPNGDLGFNFVVTSKGTALLPVDCNIFLFYTDPGL